MGDPAGRNVILDWLFGAPAAGEDRQTPSAPHTPAGAREPPGAFQPFGYDFEVRSFLPPAQVKAALRSRLRDWFDPKPGARGWVVGPFLCLWFSAIDRSGPMLLATIGRDDQGARVAGRAGSDLNGVAVFTALIPLLAFLLYQMVSAGDYTLRAGIVISGLTLASALMLWLGHVERRRGEPLVRFVEDAVARAEGRDPSAGATVSGALTLTAAGEDRAGATAEDIHDALLAVGEGDFMILSTEPETNIQTAFGDGGYILEKRDGGPGAHFRATRSETPSQAILSFDEVREALLAYAADAPPPGWLAWERIAPLTPPGRSST